MTTNTLAVKLVSDGTFLLDGGPMFGSVPKILWEKNAKPDRKNRVRLGLNSLLIMLFLLILLFPIVEEQQNWIEKVK